MAASDQFSNLDVNDKMVQEYATEVMQLRHNLAVITLRFAAALEEIDRLNDEADRLNEEASTQAPAEPFS